MKFYTFWLLCLLPFLIFGQNKFEITQKTEVAGLPFELVNNLIILKVNINGMDLNMVFDTGVKQTLLINLKSVDSLKLKNVKKRLFTGVGKDHNLVEGLSSPHNKINLQNQIYNTDALIYIITGAAFHFSENIGVNINGLIGGDLVKDYIVQIDYKRKRLYFYKHQNFNQRLLRKYRKYPIQIIRGQPYIYTYVQTTKKSKRVDSLKLLIDTGNSDALWFFNRHKIRLPKNQKTVTDYFGLGFSGEITGDRAKIYKFGLDKKIRFKHVYIGLPDSIYFKNIIQNHAFDGLLGNEILRRFYVIFDYRNQVIYLKKYHRKYREHFLFNDTGMYLAYDGKIPVKVKKLVTNFESKSDGNAISIYQENNYLYSYQMQDRIIINYIRRDSPADRAGLIRGDMLLKINGNDVYQYRLDELEKRFFYHNQKHLEFTVKRKGLILTFKVYNTRQL